VIYYSPSYEYDDLFAQPSGDCFTASGLLCDVLFVLYTIRRIITSIIRMFNPGFMCIS
jgi:hypothetical protein